MRELKFRAWIREKMQMLKWFPQFFSDTSPVTSYGDELPDDESDIILMQYIGQTDESGVEIYEGDILTATVDRCKYCATQTFVVEFLDGAFQLINPEDSSEGYFWIDVTDNSAKVVGNIYENPELLRQN